MILTCIKSFIRNEKMLFVIFILLQIIALVFTQYTFIDNEKKRNDNMVYVEKATEFSVEFDDGTILSSIDATVKQLNTDYGKELAAVSVNINGGNLRAYYFGQKKVVNYGSALSSVNDIIVSTTGEISDNRILNDTFTSCGTEFNVVGLRTASPYNEISLDAVSDSFEIESLSVVMSHLPNQHDKKALTLYLQNAFPFASIIEPINRSTATEQAFSLQMLMTLSLSFLTVINILFIFRYVIAKRKRTYIISRLCGATKTRIFLLTFSEYLIYNGFSACIATLISKFLIVPLFFGDGYYSASTFILPALLFFALCAGIAIPFLMKNCNIKMTDKRWE